MVKYQQAALDRTFAALADPTRRALLAQLDEHENVSVSELARPFPVSLPAIMKHLDVLSDAGLITRTKTGRTVSCRLAAAPMQEAVGWLNHYQRFWSERLDRLAAFLEEEESCPLAANVLIEPSLTLKRRLKASPEAVYAAWTDPEKIVKWFGPDSGPVEHAEFDVRVGGKYSIGFRTEDGEQHYVSGVYREVVPNEKLVFSWAWRSTPERVSLVTVLIKPDGAGSLLTLIHEKFFDEKARDDHRKGWTGCLDKLVDVFFVTAKRRATWHRQQPANAARMPQRRRAKASTAASAGMN